MNETKQKKTTQDKKQQNRTRKRKKNLRNNPNLFRLSHVWTTCAQERDRISTAQFSGFRLARHDV